MDEPSAHVVEVHRYYSKPLNFVPAGRQNRQYQLVTFWPEMFEWFENTDIQPTDIKIHSFIAGMDLVLGAMTRDTVEVTFSNAGHAMLFKLAWHNDED